MADRAAGAARATAIEPGLVARLSGALRYAVTGKAPGAVPSDFFGPGTPLEPVAQEAAAGRAFDFPFGANVNIRPRADEPIDFPTLRALAENCDLVRLAVETRKDQMAAHAWTIAPRDGSAPGADAQAIADFLRTPDQEHDWEDWLRLLLEDLLVIDAPTIYVRRTKGGQLYGLEVVDGATIKRVLAPDGRTPTPPSPAYQQVIKGLPAVDYTRDELLYLPRNLRVHKVYGYSPVEQLVMMVNIIIRRELFQLAYYTDGNVPDLLLGTPDAWSAKQIAEFQGYFDTLMTDDAARRRKVKYVPSGMKPIPTREPTLKDEMDEWLARVVCYAFNLPPTPFVKQMNRATATNAQEVALAEGLAPFLSWVKRKMDRIIANVFGRPDLEWQWEDQQDIDPQVQATIDDLNIRNGTATVNEVRTNRGDEPLEGGDEPGILGAPPPAPNPFTKPGAPPGAGGDGGKDATPPASEPSAAAEKVVKRRSLQRY